MSKILDTVLLLALPASGKSEVRRYIEHPDAETRARDFRMGPTVQLDDYPYVHFTRRIDDELVALGQERIYYLAGDRPFKNPYAWGTLVELLNEDYDDLIAKRRTTPPSAALAMFQRIDAAAKKCGAPQLLPTLDGKIRDALVAKLEAESQEMLKEKHANYPDSLEGKTLVIEFSRGGPDGATFPLPAPLGYNYSLATLSDTILSKAAILYIWVTPEESRRKNLARTDPNDPGSILNHGVPEEVMYKDYGSDDMMWLVEQSDKPGTALIKTRGKTFHLPFARFDNRVDKTSFLRNDPKTWTPEQIAGVHNGLKAAFAGLPE